MPTSRTEGHGQTGQNLSFGPLRIWHQAKPITSGCRWALVLFLKLEKRWGHYIAFFGGAVKLHETGKQETSILSKLVNLEIVDNSQQIGLFVGGGWVRCPWNMWQIHFGQQDFLRYSFNEATSVYLLWIYKDVCVCFLASFVRCFMQLMQNPPSMGDWHCFWKNGGSPIH